MSTFNELSIKVYNNFYLIVFEMFIINVLNTHFDQRPNSQVLKVNFLLSQ